MTVDLLTLGIPEWVPCTTYLESTMTPNVNPDEVPPGTPVHIMVDAVLVAKAVITRFTLTEQSVYQITIKDIEEMTPEGRVKKRLKDLFEPYGEALYQYWPVSNGMGAPALDVIICFNGYFLSIEAKAEKKQMTARQQNTAGKITAAKGMTIMVNEFEGWLELQSWLGEKSR